MVIRGLHSRSYSSLYGNASFRLSFVIRRIGRMASLSSQMYSSTSFSSDLNNCDHNATPASTCNAVLSQSECYSCFYYEISWRSWHDKQLNSDHCPRPRYPLAVTLSLDHREMSFVGGLHLAFGNQCLVFSGVVHF